MNRECARFARSIIYIPLPLFLNHSAGSPIMYAENEESKGILGSLNPLEELYGRI